jgi:hypothetical protein
MKKLESPPHIFANPYYSSNLLPKKTHEVNGSTNVSHSRVVSNGTKMLHKRISLMCEGILCACRSLHDDSIEVYKTIVSFPTFTHKFLTHIDIPLPIPLISNYSLLMIGNTST